MTRFSRRFRSPNMSVFRSLLRAGSRLYQRFMQRRVDPRNREIVETLQAVPALSHLSSRALYAMAGVVHRRTYRRGEVLYYEGDPGLGLYVVESGCVCLLTENETDPPRQLRELEANEMTGALSLLGDFRRLETAEARTAEARALGFFRPDLKNVMRRDPKAGAEITMALARHVAAQYVELIRLLKGEEGAEAALQTYAEAVEASGTEAPPQL